MIVIPYKQKVVIDKFKFLPNYVGGVHKVYFFLKITSVKSQNQWFFTITSTTARDNAILSLHQCNL